MPTTTMHIDLSRPSKIWHAPINQELLIQFDVLFPVEGSRVWALSSSLEKFLAVVEPSSERQRDVKGAIYRMLYVDPKPVNVVPINFRIPTDLTVRFDRLFSERGAGTWFARTTLRQLVTNLTIGGYNIEEVLEQCVNESLRKIAEVS